MKSIEFDNQQLSKLSFGTVQLGLDYGISNNSGKPTQKTADDIVEYLIHEGINCFDTATAYGNSEEVLGEAIGTSKNIQLISKVKSDLFLDDVETEVNIILPPQPQPYKAWAQPIGHCHGHVWWISQD